MNTYDCVAIVCIAQSMAAWGVNRLRGMQGWGWKIPMAGFCFIGVITLVADSGIMTIIPHDLIKLHLTHRQ